MVDAPEVHPPHKGHGGGVNWLELVISLAALFTSAVSVYIAVRHGEAMERLVAANTLPFVQVVSGNAGDDLSEKFKPSYIALRNVGVGPARVRSLKVQGPDGRYYRTLLEIAQACCSPAEIEGLKQSYTIYNLPERFIPARELEHLFTVRRTPQNMTAWAKFDDLRDRLHVTGCYCSVFGECYMLDSATGGAEPVKACAADPAREFHPLL